MVLEMGEFVTPADVICGMGKIPGSTQRPPIHERKEKAKGVAMDARITQT